jgi:hypothetical protein
MEFFIVFIIIIFFVYRAFASPITRMHSSDNRLARKVGSHLARRK